MRSSNDAEVFLSSYFSVINKKSSLNLMLFHNDEILVPKIFQLFIEADFQNFTPFSASLVFVSHQASCDVEKKLWKLAFLVSLNLEDVKIRYNDAQSGSSHIFALQVSPTSCPAATLGLYSIWLVG